MNPLDAIEAANKLATSQFTGLVILALVVAIMCMALRSLWLMFKAQMEDMRKALNQCQKDHEQCRQDNMILARAVIDGAQGRNYEAMARAQTLLTMRSDKVATE